MGVMEYLSDTKPLYHFLTRSPRLPTPSVQAVRRDVAAALGVLHEKGFIFGDPRRAVLARGRGSCFSHRFQWCLETRNGSPCLNFELGLGVVRWQIMEKSHNNSSLERIVSRLSAL